MLHLFSNQDELLRYGREHHRPHSPETSTLVLQLFKAYSEDPDMADKLKEYIQKAIDELLASLPAEELRKRLSAEDRVKGLPAEDRVKGLPAEEVIRALPAEERLKGLPTEERLKGLSAEEVIRALHLPPETLEALVRQLKANGSSAPPH